ncbi:amidase (plasmid) [Haloarcula sp. JP-L23]|nr:amidase [Haloarcula sp. JP-L23]
MSAVELRERIADGELRAREVVDAHIARIERVEGDVNAFLSTAPELARERADRIDRGDTRGGPLTGVPVGIKDLTGQVAGVPHTSGSSVFAEADVVPESNSVSVDRLEEAGTVVLGTTNTPELGHKAMTDNEVVGPTANPHDPGRNAGGSSGGSAAAVAAGMVPLATGSDSGGSIRIPAALCGVYGLKPSYRVVPWDEFQDVLGNRIHHAVVGPIARSVEDAAEMLSAMAGHLPADPASRPVDVDFRGAVEAPAADLDIAYSPDLGLFDVDEAIRETVADSLDAFREAGASVETVEVEFPFSHADLTEAFETTFSTFMASTVTTIDVREDLDLRAHPAGLSRSLRTVLDTAETVSTADLAATASIRTDLFQRVQSLFREYDLLITPTVGNNDIDLTQDFEQHVEWWTNHVPVWPFNYTGHPAASVPAGTDDDGIPVGLQVVGPRFGDETVLTASAAFEREQPWQCLYGG